MTDKTLRFLQKIKTLADKGVGGEQENAAALLNRLLRKYKLTLADLESEQTHVFWFGYEASTLKILLQTIASVIGGFDIKPKKEKQNQYLEIRCTQAEFVEIQAKFEFYWQAYTDDLAVFTRAFIQKHGLVPPDTGAEEDTDEVDWEEIKRLRKMMDVLDDKVYRKQLPTGK